jgi:UDP-2,3-diacylglucosamine pyrophosphatase LpxH
MTGKNYYPVIVLSDIHLGSGFSRTEEVTRFLQHVNCDLLILNGDIIDGWQLKKPGKRWKQVHTEFFRTLMKMMENRNMRIVYVRGNHDDFLDCLTPLSFFNVTIVKDYILDVQGRRYLVTHGDIFDAVTTRMRWLAMLGDAGYTMLLWLNRLYNRRREKQGRPYFSLAQQVKHRVKSAVSYISAFERELVKLAEVRKLNGIICGHIHQAADVWYGNIHYLNSGDWVESMTALALNEEGEWNIVTYDRSEYDSGYGNVIMSPCSSEAI